ncbi:MAG: AmmeMemoRadiSam system protein B [Anaerolineaceae bacterium]|nr:AmmeMemoRadiSam system protein B [Anaerolineaceae bacterium]
MKRDLSVRPSPIAGSWYPGAPEQLTAMIDEFLSKAASEAVEGEMIGVIVPHAGYVYSGLTAAYAFKLLTGKQFDQVIVASPYHAPSYDALISSEYQAYHTPLGDVPVDHDSLELVNESLRIAGEPQIKFIRQEREHSLEIQLPFLQRVLDAPFKLIPVMVRSHQPRTLKALAEGLARAAAGGRTLLVASSDLSHFYSEQMAHKLDHTVLNNIEAFSPEQVLQANADGSGQACGAGAIAAVLWTARAMGADHIRTIHYSTSADTTGDTSSVVGYGSAVILRGL